jgi:D-aminoacyl-tRNA deacylase
MRIVVQRVKSASVTVNGEIISHIGPRLVALVGIRIDDTIEDVTYCCQHLVNCKLWSNDSTDKPWKHSVKQKQLECLLISQFTLYGTLSKKSSYQPDYKLAMKSIAAKELYEQFVRGVKSLYGDPTKVYDGIFGAMMDVALINDGPVTIIIESKNNDTSIDHHSNNYRRIDDRMNET